MSDFWVIERLFKASVALIGWDDYAGTIGYEGPQQPATMDPAPLQFRWMTHPALGLSRRPFTLWRTQDPGGMSKQELANLSTWEPIEEIGLPVDDSWRDTPYDTGAQGPESAASGPQLSPVDAAAQRLQLGAPRIGWPQAALSGGPLPEWEPPDLEAYLVDVLRGHLLAGLHQMLIDAPNPDDQAGYQVEEADDPRYNPQLLGLRTQGAPGQTTHAAWHPLGLLLLAVGTDPLASLCLGFGTATRDSGERDTIYRVSLKPELHIGGTGFGVQLCDVLRVDDQFAGPDPPRDVAANLFGQTRPQVTDGPGIDTVAVTWQRPPNPSFGHLPAGTPRPVSYAVGHTDDRGGRILLQPRPDEVHGWQPFAPSKPDDDSPARFTDHLERSTPLGSDRDYGVAAQDLFGRWSRWSGTTYTEAGEAPRAPRLVSASLEPGGELTLDLSWDWSTRSPEFIELRGHFADAPATLVMSLRFDFEGQAEPPSGAPDLTPLSQEFSALDQWGDAQDADPAEPESRYYRLSTSVGQVDFRGKTSRELRIEARGQAHVWQAFTPAGISAWGPAVSAVAYDDSVPDIPSGIPEAPQWASLRDSAGVSRAVLRWGAVPNVAGYVLYEATETALLDAVPNPTKGYTARLADLRGLNLRSLRPRFRRVRRDLIATSSFEVELPRGSTVIHMYAVTAVGQNQKESDFPASSRAYFAVAAPRSPVPAPPTLSAELVANGGAPTVRLSAGVGVAPAPATVELFRVTGDAQSASADTMGRPLKSATPANGVAGFEDDSPPTGWQRTWYRAIAWTAADPLEGVIEARSQSSNPVSLVIPPPDPPQVSDLRTEAQAIAPDQVLVSWATSAPAGSGPLGPHRAVIEVRQSEPPGDGGDAGPGTLLMRLEGSIDTLPVFGSAAAVPPPDPENPTIMRVGSGDEYRLFAWIPRPLIEPLAEAVAKVVDPLGRIGSASLPVP